MPGWVRADKAVATLAAEEMLRLRRTIDELKEKLSKSELEGPEGSVDLAQGEEVFPVKFTFSYTDRAGAGWDCTRVITISWNDIFQGVGSLMLDGLTEEQFREILNRVVEGEYLESGQMEKDEHLQDCDRIRDVLIDWRDEQTIKIQFRALGLIEYSKGQGRSDSEWRLTAFGDSSLLKLCAIRKNDFKDWQDESESSSEEAILSLEAPALETSPVV